MEKIEEHKPFILRMFLIVAATLFIFQTLGTYLDAFDTGGAEHVVSMAEGPQYYIVYTVLYFLIPYSLLALILVLKYRPVDKMLKEITIESTKEDVTDIIKKF